MRQRISLFRSIFCAVLAASLIAPDLGAVAQSAGTPVGTAPRVDWSAQALTMPLTSSRLPFQTTPLGRLVGEYLLEQRGRKPEITENTVLVIGDLDGQLDSLRSLLRLRGYIDANGHWVAGRGTLIQMGDAVGRTAGSIPTWEYLRHLQAEAEQAGGRVIRLLGNHEWKMATGDPEKMDKEALGDQAIEQLADMIREDVALGRVQAAHFDAELDRWFLHAGLKPEMMPSLVSHTREWLGRTGRQASRGLDPADLADYLNERARALARREPDAESKNLLNAILGVGWFIPAGDVGAFARGEPHVIAHNVREGFGMMDTHGLVIGADVGVGEGRLGYLELDRATRSVQGSMFDPDTGEEIRSQVVAEGNRQRFVPLAVGALLALLVAVMTTALPDTPGWQYACGVLGILFTLPPDLRSRAANPGVIPVFAFKVFDAMNKVTVSRGEHSSGAFVKLGDRFVGDKMVNPKRDSMPDALHRLLEQALTKDAAKFPKESLPETVVLMAHDRYSTSSDPTDLDETQPHDGESPRRRRIFSLESGQPVSEFRIVDRPVRLIIAHNGDHDAIRWWHSERLPLAEKASKERLVEILSSPNSLKGDTPTLALTLSLLRTQGDAYASARLAYQETFDWKVQQRLPTDEELTRWSEALIKSFEAFRSRPSWKQLSSLSDISQEDRETLVEELHGRLAAMEDSKSSVFSAHEPGYVRHFADRMVTDFLHNSLLAAIGEAAARGIGTYGVGVVSSVDDEPVFFASQQPIYLARNRKRGVLAWNSESKALAIQVKNEAGNWEWAFDERLQLNHERKERAQFHRDGRVTVIDGLTDRELSREEVAARWVHMPTSPYIRPLRVNGYEPKPLKESFNESAPIFDSIVKDWDNPRSYNRLTAGAWAERFIELAAMEHLPKGAHVLLTGYHTDYAMAVQFADMLRQVFPELRIETVPANEWVGDADEQARVRGVTADTLVLAVSRPGEDAPTLNAVMDLKTRVRHIYGVTGGEHGDLDTVLASVLGQDLHAHSPLAKRVFVTGQPWPRRQALVNNHMATTQTLNRLLFQTILAVRQSHPSGQPLGMLEQTDEVEQLMSFQRFQRVMIANITSSQSTGAHQALTTLARQESKDFGENRVVKWLTRGLFLFPLLYVANEFQWMPHVLVPGLLHPSLVVGVFRALVDLGFIVAMSVAIYVAYRWAFSRQIAARVGGTRTIAFVSREVHYYAQDFMRKLLSLSRPDATAFVIGAHTTGDQNSDYLQDVAPSLKRGDLMVNMQTDNRFALSSVRENEIRMAATQTRVNRSLPFGRYVLALNRWVKPRFGIRIPFAHTRVITIGRSWTANANAEDARIELPTFYFPFPPFMERFFAVLEAAGAPLTLSQKIRLFVARRDYATDPRLLTAPDVVAQELASAIGLADAATFTGAFKANHLSLFPPSDGPQTARQLRVQRWVERRFHSIEDNLALAVFSDALVDPLAHPQVLRHESYPMGQTQPGSLIPTTASPTPGSRVAERVVLHESKLESLADPAAHAQQTSTMPEKTVHADARTAKKSAGSVNWGALFWTIALFAAVAGAGWWSVLSVDFSALSPLTKDLSERMPSFGHAVAVALLAAGSALVVGRTALKKSQTRRAA